MPVPKTNNLQPWTINTTVSVTVLAMVAVSLRLLARREKGLKLWWDDYMIVWSMLWNLMVVGFIFAMLPRGLGIHADKVDAKDIVILIKFVVVAELLYVFNLVWTKLSFLFLFYRIFRFRYFKVCAYIIGTFVILWAITITFLLVFICVPLQRLWYPDVPGRCIDKFGVWIANAISTIVTNVAILVLPLREGWKLQLRWKDKIAVLGTFFLGFFVVFASGYRFAVLFTYRPENLTYTLAPTVGWTAIEMSAGIISACLPTMLPAFKFLARKLGLNSLLPRKDPGSHDTSHSITTIGHKGHERYVEVQDEVVTVFRTSNVSDEIALGNVAVEKGLTVTDVASTGTRRSTF